MRRATSSRLDVTFCNHEFTEAAITYSQKAPSVNGHGVARALPHPVETETVAGEMAQSKAANALPKDPSSVSSMHMRVGQLNCL